MKKTLLILLAIATLFAFTQCDSNAIKKSRDKNTEEEFDEDASQEYQDFVKAIKEYEKLLKKAESCEDLYEADEALENSRWYKKTMGDAYDDDELMTKSEEKEFNKRADKIEKLLDELYEEFGCDEDDDDWNDWNDSDNWDDWDYYGSSQYSDLKKAYDEATTTIRNAQDCDDLESALWGLLVAYFQDYEDSELMTSSEEAKIDKLSDEFNEMYERKAKQFGGCDDDSDDNWWDDDNDDDWSWDDDDNSSSNFYSSSSYSSSGNYSEALKQAKKILEEAIADVKKASDCDDLDTAVFTAVFSLLAIDGIDEIPDSELEELDDLTDKLDQEYESKKARLGCQDDDDDDWDW